MSDTTRMLSGKEIVDCALEKMIEKKAENIIVFNPGDQSEIAEYILLCQGESDVQNRAISHAIVDYLNSKNNPVWLKEGVDDGRWILLDYSNVLVNIMLPDVRGYYNLDELWKAHPKEIITDTNES